MNERKQVLDLWNKISNLIEIKLQKHKTDHTFKATIWKINSDKTYSINYKGQLYNIPNASGIDISLGQTVFVKIPDGIFRNMYIESVPNIIMASSGGGSGDFDEARIYEYIDNQIYVLSSECKNVQPNWIEEDTSSDAYIKNKPKAITNQQIDSLF